MLYFQRPAHVNFYLSVLLLTMTISQSQSEKLICYCKNIYVRRKTVYMTKTSWTKSEQAFILCMNISGQDITLVEFLIFQ